VASGFGFFLLATPHFPLAINHFNPKKAPLSYLTPGKQIAITNLDFIIEVFSCDTAGGFYHLLFFCRTGIKKPLLFVKRGKFSQVAPQRR
jgi:hypothetical protein